MHLASRVVRPPYEARSVYLQVTTGCSHDKCKFCTYYKNVPFTFSPRSEIVHDLEELRSNGYTFRRIWLQGADPFVLSFKELEEIAHLIHEYLPFVESIGCYARVDNLVNKSVDELVQLRDLGYKSIVFGVESGDDNLLEYMNKGYQSSDIIEQLSKMDEAQLSYTVIFLNGMGGHIYGEGHAKKTAELINKLHPEHVMILGLTVFDDTPLNKDIMNGKYVEATEKERIHELIVFLEELKIDTFIYALNSSNVTPMFGRVQESKTAMIRHLRKSYEKYGEKLLRNKRENLKQI